MENGRREFVRLLVYFGVGAAVAGCGEDPAEGTGTPSCSTFGGKATSITANHGHVLAVPVAHFAGGDHTYTIDGTSGHSHSITLTAAQLADIMAGSSVQVASTESAVPVVHNHTVTVGCASSGGAGGGGGGGGGGGYDP